jgi:hypothetical protein
MHGGIGMKNNRGNYQRIAPKKANEGPRLVLQVRQMRSLRARGGFGLNEVIGIAAGIIIAVVVVIPGLQSFAGNILDNLTNWWNNMAASVFATP